MKKLLLFISVLSLAISCGVGVGGSSLKPIPNEKKEFTVHVYGGKDLGFSSSAVVTVYKGTDIKDTHTYEDLHQDGFSDFAQRLFTAYENSAVTFQFFPSEAHTVRLFNKVEIYSSPSYKEVIIEEIAINNNKATAYIRANKYKNYRESFRVVFEIASPYATEPTLSGYTYEVRTVEELRFIATRVQNGYEDFAGKTVKLMNDIDLEDKEFTGIGTGGISSDFFGTFDGNDFEIQNLNIVPSDIGSIALIGSLAQTGVVKNLGITGSISSEHDNFFISAAGIVNINKGTINNVYNKANITGYIVSGIASRNSGTIKNAYNGGNLEGELASGIVSYNEEDGIIDNVYNTGTIGNSDAFQTSGLVLWNYIGAILKNAYNIGIINVGKFTSSVVYFNQSSSEVENVYYLKDVNINKDIQPFSKNDADHANTINVEPKTVADFNNNTGFIFDDPDGVWEFRTGLPAINGITARYVLKGVGEGK